MKVSTFACDNCGQSRDKDANHWFVLGAHTQHEHPSALGTIVHHVGAWVCTFDKYVGTGEAVTHACGQECAFAMLARFLATGRFEREPVADMIKAGR